MQQTRTSLPSTASKIVRDRPGSARLPSTYVRQRSLSMTSEIQQGPRFSLANIREIERQAPYTLIDPAKSPELLKNNVAKLRQQFDRPRIPETGGSVALTNTTTLPSSDSVSTLQVEQTVTVRTDFATASKRIAPSNRSISSDLSTSSVVKSHRPPSAYPRNLAFFQSRSNSHCDTDAPVESPSSMSTASTQKNPFVDLSKHIHAPSGGFLVNHFIKAEDKTAGEKNATQSPTAPPLNQEEAQAIKETKLRRHLEETYSTEESYTKVLYVLAVKLPRQVKKTCRKDEELLKAFNQLFQPLLDALAAIYKLHYRPILRQMAKSLTGHRPGVFWSILEDNFELIEGLYKAYYIAFDDVQQKLEEFCRTHALIHEAMLSLQEDLGNLYPITQLNSANQRLLRYIILMEAYMKHLDQSSTEFEYCTFIHDELQRIAVRCNEQLVISPSQANKLKLRLDNRGELLKDQKLIWHGSLRKQSARKYVDITRRYLIVLSGTVLVCRESGGKLELKREHSVKDITISATEITRVPQNTTSAPGEQLNVGQIYPFRMSAVEKSYEFIADKESDRDLWIKKITEAREDFVKRFAAIEIRKPDLNGNYMGIRAPSWIHDTDVTRCQHCNNHFPQAIILSSRRHHCRSCGRCVCGNCSSKKILLNYCKNEGEVRVCDQCYSYVTGVDLSRPTPPQLIITRDPDRTILAGDFRSASTNTIVWIALQEDHQLHVYGAKLDKAEDYSIKLANLQELILLNETRTFILQENNKTHKFSIESTHRMDYSKNDYIADKLKLTSNKLSAYAALWFEGMQLGRKNAVPAWYVRKRESADSGVAES